MKHNLWGDFNKFAASFSLSAAVLATTNVETIWQEYHHQQLQENNIWLGRGTRSGNARARIQFALTGASFRPLQSSLSRSLEQDKLRDDNPFAHLSSLEPMQQLMQKGVAKFRRKAYRGPDFQKDGGYDLLVYEIEHPGGSKSTILAYLEWPQGNWGNADPTNSRIVFVVFMLGEGERALYSFFRDGDLIEQSELSNSAADALIQRRISQGVPLLSVSR